MRDLLNDPMCRADDLGVPIPPTPYGVSVCLPLWEHVIGYEEKDPRIVSKFQSGYPRFFIPPAIAEPVPETETPQQQDEVVAQFDTVTITKKTFENTKTEMQTVVEKLNKITLDRDY